MRRAHSASAIRRAAATVQAVRSGYRGAMEVGPAGTNRSLYTDLNPLEAMLCYKQLWTVEQTFCTAKEICCSPVSCEDCCRLRGPIHDHEALCGKS